MMFVSPGLDSSFKRLKIKDLTSESLWQDILKLAKVISDRGPGNELVFEFPGRGSLDDRTGIDVFHVYFGTDPDYMPVKVVGFSKHGFEYTWMVEEYQEVEHNQVLTQWPKTVNTVTMEKGKFAVSERSIIKVLSVGENIDPGIFDLDFTSADSVWDDDLGMTVKAPNRFEPYRQILAEDLTNTHQLSDSSDEVPGGEVLYEIEEVETGALVDKPKDTPVGTEAVVSPANISGKHVAVGLTFSIAFIAVAIYGLTRNRIRGREIEN
jgi:hypothetical protein